jgi:hypothetical protein
MQARPQVGRPLERIGSLRHTQSHDRLQVPNVSTPSSSPTGPPVEQPSPSCAMIAA